MNSGNNDSKTLDERVEALETVLNQLNVGMAKILAQLPQGGQTSTVLNQGQIGQTGNSAATTGIPVGFVKTRKGQIVRMRSKRPKPQFLLEAEQGVQQAVHALREHAVKNSYNRNQVVASDTEQASLLAALETAKVHLKKVKTLLPSKETKTQAS